MPGYLNWWGTLEIFGLISNGRSHTKTARNLSFLGEVFHPRRHDAKLLGSRLLQYLWRIEWPGAQAVTGTTVEHSTYLSKRA